jgi:glutaredoxin
MPDSIIIEILTKQDCFLCDEVKDVVTRVLPDYPVRLVMTDIESDSKLFDQFKEKIPVVRINGEESFIYKAHETTLRRKLDKTLEKK